MIKFDNIADMVSYQPKCFVCKKKLQNFVAGGKYEDVVNFGHKTKALSFKLTKKELKVTKSLKIEDFDITVDYVFDTKDNTMKAEFTPSSDDIVNRFQVAQGFYELDEDRYAFAQDNGIIHIWRVLRWSQEPLFFVQACEGHYKRISHIVFDHDGEKIVQIGTYDEFMYVPTFKKEDERYVIYDHSSPSTKNKRSIFIQVVKQDQIDNIDPNRGGVYLREPDDTHLMKFDLSDVQKLSRKLNMLCALKG